MDRGSPDKNKAEDSRKYNAAEVPTDWRLSGANLTNASMGLIPAENRMGICKADLMESSSCSTASMVDSFCATIWDQPTTDSQNMGFCDVNVQNITSSSSRFEFRKDNLGPPRTDLEQAIVMGWNPNNPMLKESMLLPTSTRMVPQSLSQFPTDSGFIERAARFSCFSGGNFSNLANPFTIPESMSPYTRGPAPMQGTQEVLAGSRLNSSSVGQSQINEMSTAELSKDDIMPIEHGPRRGSPINIERSNSFLRSNDQAKQALCEPGNESDEAEFSGGGAQAEPSALGSGGTPAKTHGFKKRKRIGQVDNLYYCIIISNIVGYYCFVKINLNCFGRILCLLKLLLIHVFSRNLSLTKSGVLQLHLKLQMTTQIFNGRVTRIQLQVLVSLVVNMVNRDLRLLIQTRKNTYMFEQEEGRQPIVIVLPKE